jgi:hypothetical protein
MGAVVSRRKAAPALPAASRIPYTVWELRDVMGIQPPVTVVYQSKVGDFQAQNCNQRILGQVMAYTKEDALRELAKGNTVK